MRQGLVVDGPGGTVAHAELWWQDAAVFVETREASGEVVNAGRSVVCLVARDDAEVDRIYQRALSAHTHVELPRGDTAFGSHQFALRDAENNIWTIGTYQPVPPG